MAPAATLPVTGVHTAQPQIVGPRPFQGRAPSCGEAGRRSALSSRALRTGQPVRRAVYSAASSSAMRVTENRSATSFLPSAA